MERRRLGGSALTVTDICMGTMTFGAQNNEQESFEIMDCAYDAGIDFYDAAEIYPVPPDAATVGLTEEIVGRWMKTKPRDSVIIATKVTGPAHGWFTPPVRHGHTAFDRVQITRAVEDSLRRLQTDYIDLYQTHWPDHGARYEDILETLTILVKQGKVRAIGCSNETCWGVMKSLGASEQHGLCRYDSIQNNFSLLNRRCESELAQVCRREGLSLLPYSPLGGGVLTGKYQGGIWPEGARFTAYQNAGERQQKMASRFLNERSRQTVDMLVPIAQDLGVSLAGLATAWSRQHDFVASTIIGATSIPQLQESLQAIDLILDVETLARIDEIDEQIPNPLKEDGLRRL